MSNGLKLMQTVSSSTLQKNGCKIWYSFDILYIFSKTEKMDFKVSTASTLRLQKFN